MMSTHPCRQPIRSKWRELVWYGVAAASLMSLWGCEGRLNRFVERADSAGIEIVRNTSGDRALRWRFVERVRVRDSMLGLGSLPIGPGHAGADSLGDLYVLDRARSRIVVFDSTGSLARVVGESDRRSDGLDNPVSMTVTPDGTLRVFDRGRARMLEFDRDGRNTAQQPIEVESWDWRVVPALDGIVGVRRIDASDEATGTRSVRQLVAVTPSDTVELARRTDSTATFEVGGCQVTASAEPLFAPRLVWDAVPDLVAVTSRSAYAVNWFASTGPWRSIRRAVAPRPTNEMAAMAQLAGGLVVTTPDGPCRSTPEDEIRRRGVAPFLPPVEGIVLQLDQTMWVIRGRFRGEDPLVDVFSPGGGYLGTLPQGSPIPIAFTPSGGLVSVEPGEEVAPQLVVYEVDRRR